MSNPRIDWLPEQTKMLKALYRDKQRWSSVEIAFRLNQEFGTKRKSTSINQKVYALTVDEELKGRDKGAVYVTKEALDGMAKVDGKKTKPGPMLRLIKKSPAEDPGRKAAATRKKNGVTTTPKAKKAGPKLPVGVIIRVATDKAKNREAVSLLQGALGLGMTLPELLAVLEEAAA